MRTDVQILDFLSKNKWSSLTDLQRQLQIPDSTLLYNRKKLKMLGLIEVKYEIGLVKRNGDCAEGIKREIKRTITRLNITEKGKNYLENAVYVQE